MEEEIIIKQKPHTSFNRWLSVAKNPERGTWQRPWKNLKNFILQGEHDKGGNMTKGITVIIFIYSKRNIGAKEAVIEIKSSMIINPYDNFMFKDVIIDALVKIPKILTSIANYDSFFSINVLALQIILEIRLNREEIDFIFSQYYSSTLYESNNTI